MVTRGLWLSFSNVPSRSLDTATLIHLLQSHLPSVPPHLYYGTHSHMQAVITPSLVYIHSRHVSTRLVHHPHGKTLAGEYSKLNNNGKRHMVFNFKYISSKKKSFSQTFISLFSLFKITATRVEETQQMTFGACPPHRLCGGNAPRYYLLLLPLAPAHHPHSTSATDTVVALVH